MNVYARIAITWIVLEGFCLLCIQMFSLRDLEILMNSMAAVDLLLSIVCYFLIRMEVDKGNKAVFINLGILFSFMGIGFSLLPLIDEALLGLDPYVPVYRYQYIDATYYSLLLFVVSYFVVEIMSHRLKIYQKYVLAVLMTVCVSFYLYYPIVLNPKYLYTTEDVADYRVISHAVDSYKKSNQEIPEASQLASEVSLPSSYENQSIEKKRDRIASLLPYLEGKNYLLMIYKPLFQSGICINVLCVVLIFVTIRTYYKIDGPRSPYIEKILLLFIPYCMLEAAHLVSFCLTPYRSVYAHFHTIAVIVSRSLELLFLILFLLRVRFLTSPLGNYYEHKLMSDPLSVARWRDFIDDFIIRNFLDQRKFRGRLYSRRSGEIDD